MRPVGSVYQFLQTAISSPSECFREDKFQSHSSYGIGLRPLSRGWNSLCYLSVTHMQGKTKLPSPISWWGVARLGLTTLSLINEQFWGWFSGATLDTAPFLYICRSSLVSLPPLHLRLSQYSPYLYIYLQILMIGSIIQPYGWFQISSLSKNSRNSISV